MEPKKEEQAKPAICGHRSITQRDHEWICAAPPHPGQPAAHVYVRPDRLP